MVRSLTSGGKINSQKVVLTFSGITYTHKKLVAAYRSVRRNLSLLFTYKNHKHLSMFNTTNLIEGGVFSPLKILIKIHSGLSKSLKLKIVDDYLLNYKKK